MGKNRHGRYNEPSDAECFILKQLLDRIYLDRDASNRYSPFRISFPEPDDRFRLPHVWTNTPRELHEQYESECPAEKGFRRCTESNIRKILKRLEDEGIIRRTESNEKVSVESRYYPVETSEGYLSLIRHVEEDYRRGFYPNGRMGLDPLYSKFSETVLNRQFILDSLRGKMRSVRVLKEGKLMDLPLFGRYRKNYELGPRIKGMMNTLEEIKGIIEDGSEIDYRKVRDILLDTDEPLPESCDKDYYKLSQEKKESNLVYLERLGKGLSEALRYLESQRELFEGGLFTDNKEIERKRGIRTMRRFSDRNTEGYAEHLDSMSPGHQHMIILDTEVNGLHWYGQEATWLDPVLTEDEERMLEEIDKEIAEQYPVWLNDRVVMPLLCLAQLSPSALINIAYPENCRNEDGIYGFSDLGSHRPFAFRKAGTVPEDILNFEIGPKAFNDYLGVLCKCAIGDYLTGRVRVRGQYQHEEITKTQLMTFGYSGVITADESDSYAVPALFTFKAFKDYTVSIMFSESPVYNIMWDVMSPPDDHPRPVLFDWSPAIADCECRVDSPSTWMLETHGYIMDTVCEKDSCLHHLISQALMKGTM